MARFLILPFIPLALAGCTDLLATAYKPVEQQIVGIATEKKEPAPATPPAAPAIPAPGR